MATSALYADVAERFESDELLDPGTVVELGGAKEITRSRVELSENVFGVISTRPAFTMNGGAGENDTHPAVAMTGRVPVNVTGIINKVMGKNTMLSGKELSNMVALQKSAGITADEMGALVEAFDTMGVGVEGAVSSVDDLADKARGLGLNVGAFLSTTAKNLKLVNSYGFKDGVEGLTRMVARSQALRIDMTSVKGLAADLLNPEKAIELAAEFQNLGGAIGALGDPFQLMNLGQKKYL